MGLFDFLKSKPRNALRVRCGMCKRATDYPEAQRGEFVFHSCDADLLVAEIDPTAHAAALDLFVLAYEHGPPQTEERIAARDRLLYESSEAAIPGLEDLLYRLKYELAEPWPFPEIASRVADLKAIPLRIDFGNELEMYLHRMKKFAITKRQIERVPESARGILRDKLERLKTAELVPLEED